MKKTEFVDLLKKDEGSKKQPNKKQLKRLTRLEAKPSFLGLLIGSYVTFTLITFLAILLIFLLFNWLSRYQQVDLSTAKLPDFSVYLKSEEYSKIPTVSIFGVDGWFEVVEEDGTFVYSSTGTSHEYTLDELALIKASDSKDTIVTKTLVSDDGNSYVITRHYFVDDKEHNAYLVLDKDYNAISGDLGLGKTSFTQKEYEILSYESEHPYYVFAKYAYKMNDDTNRYVVFLDTNDKVDFKFEYIIGIMIGIAIIIYAVVMAIYIQYINRNVQQPLAAITIAMRRFARDGYRETINYSGPTEFEQLAASFNEMVSLLNATEMEKQELEKRRQRMLAGLSHDLKTPITIIQGFSKAIRDDVIAEADKKRYLDLIVSKSENMGELINSFYEFSKLDHPDFTYNMESADVAELVRSHIASIYDEFNIRKYNLETDITEEQLFAKIDSPMMIRVIDNVVSNFFKYTPVGSTLLVEVKKDEEYVKIEFADNGNGIQKEAREDIFEPFVVGEKSRNNQGSGLGLAVCQKIVTAMGGTISLAEKPRSGFVTQFDILIPLASVDNSI